MAQALATFQVAERERQEAEYRAKAALDAERRQANDARDRGLKAAQSRATAERAEINRLLSEVDRYLREAEDALRAAGLPIAGGNIANPAIHSSHPPDQAFRAAFNDVVRAYHELGKSLTELERVRGTLLVRAMRKIGLPPI